MHPTDQISIAFEYSDAFRIISGALYHLVTTYSVNSGFELNPLDNPKSQIFKSQSWVNKRLLGFKSRWIISEECINKSPLKIW